MSAQLSRSQPKDWCALRIFLVATCGIRTRKSTETKDSENVQGHCIIKKEYWGMEENRWLKEHSPYRRHRSKKQQFFRSVCCGMRQNLQSFSSGTIIQKPGKMYGFHCIDAKAVEVGIFSWRKKGNGWIPC